MPQPMTGVLVLIASPGDTSEERASVSEALMNWNVTRGRRDGVALLPWLFERHAVPRMGGRPQEIINSQAVDQCDIVVAFFDSRLGTATEVDVSGTAEEISRAVGLGKRVHVYFSLEDLPRNVESEQLLALRAFQAELETQGLLGYYTDPADLVGQVERAVESDIHELGYADSARVLDQPSAADLRWRHEHEQQPRGFDKNGRMQYRTTKNRLVVSNEGTAAAEGLTFAAEGLHGTQFVMPEPPTDPVTVPAHSTMEWLLIPTPSMGAAGKTVHIKAMWAEGGTEKGGEWTIALN